MHIKKKRSENVISVLAMREKCNLLWFGLRYITPLSKEMEASACVLIGGREQLGGTGREERQQTGLASLGEQIAAPQSDEKQLCSERKRPEMCRGTRPENK